MDTQIEGCGDPVGGKDNQVGNRETPSGGDDCKTMDASCPPCFLKPSKYHKISLKPGLGKEGRGEMVGYGCPEMYDLNVII